MKEFCLQYEGVVVQYEGVGVQYEGVVVQYEGVVVQYEGVVVQYEGVVLTVDHRIHRELYFRKHLSLIQHALLSMLSSTMNAPGTVYDSSLSMSSWLLKGLGRMISSVITW